MNKSERTTPRNLRPSALAPPPAMVVVLALVAVVALIDLRMAQQYGRLDTKAFEALVRTTVQPSWRVVTGPKGGDNK